MGTRVKRPGREINHLPLHNARAKNEWIYTSTAHDFLGFYGENFACIIGRINFVLRNA
jgi:hypothetical protein